MKPFFHYIVAFIEKLGKPVNGVCSQIMEVISLLWETLYWIVVGPFKKKSVKKDSSFEQMVYAGIGSLAISLCVVFFTGVVIAMQSAYQLKQFGAVVYVAGLVAVSLARELGPVLTALVVAGRVGAAITAELGTMKVSEQIEALETLALNPVRFLVVPRFLGLVCMVPCLTMINNVAGMFGGFLIGTLNLNINPYLYIDTTFRFLVAKDVITGIIKSFVFAITIALIASHQGLKTKGGAEGVGKSTTLSVVLSFVFIIIFDCILTGVFFFSNV